MTPQQGKSSILIICSLLLSNSSFGFSPTPNVHQRSNFNSLNLAMSSSTSDSSQPTNVVIAGSGIMATATAYYLAKEFSIPSTLIDPSGEIAPAASGKAGGFLAKVRTVSPGKSC
jgi:hypothetical protein